MSGRWSGAIFPLHKTAAYWHFCPSARRPPRPWKYLWSIWNTCIAPCPASLWTRYVPNGKTRKFSPFDNCCRRSECKTGRKPWTSKQVTQGIHKQRISCTLLGWLDTFLGIWKCLLPTYSIPNGSLKFGCFTATGLCHAASGCPRLPLEYFSGSTGHW